MDTFLFDLASQLTGGLITDMKTAMAAMLLFGFIIIGLDMLLEVFGYKINELRMDHMFNDAEYWDERRKTSSGIYRDYANARYRRSIGRAASLGHKLNDRW